MISDDDLKMELMSKTRAFAMQTMSLRYWPASLHSFFGSFGPSCFVSSLHPSGALPVSMIIWVQLQLSFMQSSNRQAASRRSFIFAFTSFTDLKMLFRDAESSLPHLT